MVEHLGRSNKLPRVLCLLVLFIVLLHERRPLGDFMTKQYQDVLVCDPLVVLTPNNYVGQFAYQPYDIADNFIRSGN